MAKVVITIEDMENHPIKGGRMSVTMESDPPMPGSPNEATPAQIVAMGWLTNEIDRAGGLDKLEALSVEKSV